MCTHCSTHWTAVVCTSTGAGVLTVARTADFEDFDVFQPHQLRKRRAAPGDDLHLYVIEQGGRVKRFPRANPLPGAVKTMLTLSVEWQFEGEETGLLGLAFDPAFADWIDANVAFPNGMVDRITPATGAREIAIVADEYGIEDAWPVFCEEFKQWVLEDHFPSAARRWRRSACSSCLTLRPTEHMKIRILNGGHAIIGYPAELLGIEHVHEAMADPTIAAFVDKIEKRRDRADRSAGSGPRSG